MATRRLELGFEGGTTLRLSLEEAAAAQLTGSLGGAQAWHELSAEEGTYWVNLAEVRYVRLAPGEPPGRVGFGGV